jgi:hypothetical protein
MAKKVDDTVLDGLLDIIATATEIYICTSEPADRAAAITTSLISAHTLTSGDFTKANGDASGRKITIAQQATLPITTTGDATHIALCTGSLLLLVTTCTTQTLTSGGTVTIPAFDDEVADPT